MAPGRPPRGQALCKGLPPPGGQHAGRGGSGRARERAPALLLGRQHGPAAAAASRRGGGRGAARGRGARARAGGGCGPGARPARRGPPRARKRRPEGGSGRPGPSRLLPAGRRPCSLFPRLWLGLQGRLLQARRCLRRASSSSSPPPPPKARAGRVQARVKGKQSTETGASGRKEASPSRVESAARCCQLVERPKGWLACPETLLEQIPGGRAGGRGGGPSPLGLGLGLGWSAAVRFGLAPRFKKDGRDGEKLERVRPEKSPARRARSEVREADPTLTG